MPSVAKLSIQQSPGYRAYSNDSATEQLFPETRITMYADDLLLHREIKCIEDYSKLQQDVNKLASWVDDNKLTLNSKKINVSTSLFLDFKKNLFQSVQYNSMANHWKESASTSI